jgi:hypothetical protein
VEGVADAAETRDPAAWLGISDTNFDVQKGN